MIDLYFYYVKKMFFCRFAPMLKNKIFLPLLFLIPLLIFSQNQKEIFKHDVFWFNFEVRESLDDKWGLGADYLYRSSSDIDNSSPFASLIRSSIRPWVHYRLSSTSGLSLSPIGYMYSKPHVASEEDKLRPSNYELRTTFQFLHNYTHFNGKLTHTFRYRYEFRFREQVDQSSLQFTSRFRIRYQARYLLNSDNFYEKKTLYTSISNEISISIGKNVLYNTFHQNRLYVAMGYRFFNSARVELRYVNQYITRGSTGFEFDNGRGVMLSITIDQLSEFLK